MAQPISGGRERPADASARLEEVVERFERAWREGPRPDLGQFLPDDGPLRRAALVELAHVDLERRLKAREPARVEDYVQRFPELRDRRDAVLDLIAAEYAFRRRIGSRFDPGEYERRFPEYRGELPPAPVPSAGAEASSGRGCGAAPATSPGKGPPVMETVPGVTAQELPALAAYQVLRELGRGGMGVVYLANQVGLKRLVALKIILSAAEAGLEELGRFRTEAEATARVRHPNIVGIYEVGSWNGLPYLALEFCPGGSLDKRLRGRRLLPHAAAALVQTLAHAVHASHVKGVVHRDLKPANVLFAEDGTPKVSDFGLAKKLDEPGQTASGAILGTPSYMAPEQARGKARAVSPATDVYALGAILYECLTGRPPFLGPTPVDTILQVLGEEAVPPRQLRPSTPRDLQSICLKCLRKDWRERYASALELADDLGRFLRGEPVWARRADLVGRWQRWSEDPARIGGAAALPRLMSWFFFFFALLGALLPMVSLDERHLTFASVGPALLKGLLAGGVLAGIAWFLRWFASQVTAGRLWALWAGFGASSLLFAFCCLLLIVGLLTGRTDADTLAACAIMMSLVGGVLLVPVVYYRCALKARHVNRDLF
jgi:serine/threonine protein kinase